MEDGIGISFPLRSGERRFAAGVSINRTNRRTWKRSLPIFETLAPHIGRGFENLAWWDEAGRAGAAYERLAAEVAEPIVVLARKPRSRRYSLAVATGGAERVLDLSATSTRNLHLQEFLRDAPKAKGSGAGSIEWTARNGRTYLLSSRNTKNGAPDGALLVRLEATGIEPALHADDRAAALRRGLTWREADVFVQLAQGKSNKEIAHALGLSYDTARAHVRNIFEKLGVTSRLEAVNAVRNG